MSEAQVPGSFEWLDIYYQQQTLYDDLEVPFGGISNSISDSTSFGDDVFPGSNTILTPAISEEAIFGPDSTGTNTGVPEFNPENSSLGSNDLSPKATIAKQVRRKSRATRRIPTTLLNASIKDFRALVQQYTGCHSATSAFQNRKGSITLNFGSSREQNDFPASLATAFGNGNYYYTEQAQFQNQQHQCYQQHVDQVYQPEQNLF